MSHATENSQQLALRNRDLAIELIRENLVVFPEVTCVFAVSGGPESRRQAIGLLGWSVGGKETIRQIANLRVALLNS